MDPVLPKQVSFSRNNNVHILTEMIMKPILIILFTATVGLTSANAQGSIVESISFEGGTAYPYKPDSFHDYWNSGTSFGANAAVPLYSRLDLVLTIDYTALSFDPGRFFKKLKLDGNTITLNGGATSVVIISANLRFLMPWSGFFRHRVFVGGGILNSSVSKVTIEYPAAPVVKEAQTYRVLAIPVGSALEVSATNDIDLFVEYKYVFASTSEEITNTNYLDLRVGVAYKL